MVKALYESTGTWLNTAMNNAAQGAFDLIGVRTDNEYRSVGGLDRKFTAVLANAAAVQGQAPNRKRHHQRKM
jgi:hypothetical protein